MRYARAQSCAPNQSCASKPAASFLITDYLFMLICGAAALITLPGLLFGHWLAFTTEPLIFMTVYVWSKHFPDDKVRRPSLHRVRARRKQVGPSEGEPAEPSYSSSRKVSSDWGGRRSNEREACGGTVKPGYAGPL